MSKRKIKEEMLQVVAPEIYGPPQADQKPRKIKRVKKKDEVDEGAVEFVREFAPRRRVNWKGRRVQRVLRPGTAVVFTPGERSSVRSKRSYDEVYGDDDILDQAAERAGEFAYGKRSREEELISLPLDESNPTPSLKPVTLQQVLPSRGIKREGENMYPTMQIMVPKRRRVEDVLDTVKMDVEPEVKVRPIKQVAPGLGVQTVDIQIPTDMDVDKKPSTSIEVQTDPWLPASTATASTSTAATATEPPRRRRWGPANRLMPNYVLHPSIIPTPGYRGTRYYASRSLVLPTVRYHPSIL
ncbi:pV [Human adenovirus 53]|uniref:PV n=1 Tax=Human mastadenovirus D TaxID=130310 RepID=B6DUA0_9ADEN|nr:pV [Human mastadenovirus D]